MTTIPLRYGCNPHQTPAAAEQPKNLPLRVLNGAPSYINLLDALNSWQLVQELRQALQRPAAASFKHVSPAGAAVAAPLGDALRRAYFVDDLELSDLATAYARARGTDRMSSYGDWVALSDPVDVPTAQLLRREVSDGVIAPAYEDEALAILRQKQNGRYRIFQMDPAYTPPTMEMRELFGITLEQRRNDRVIDTDLLQNVVTAKSELSADAQRDLLVAYITLKYTQSNSVCFAYDGQTIGVGAGQQSRIHCTALAAAKARLWYLRQHPQVLAWRFKPRTSRPAQDTAIAHILDDMLPTAANAMDDLFIEHPAVPSVQEKADWLNTLQGVALGSDGYIPFRDNIDVAHGSGVQSIIQPGGSLRDDDVIAACDEHGIAMVFTDLRLFHH